MRYLKHGPRLVQADDSGTRERVAHRLADIGATAGTAEAGRRR